VKALDTNVLVRYLAQDDPGQAARASRLLESLTPQDPGFIPIIVITELFWVLTRSYRITHSKALDILDSLLCMESFRVEAADRVRQALKLSRQHRLGFSDALIIVSATDHRCEAVYSFDQAATRSGLMTPLDEAGLGEPPLGEIRR
jgi:predicted nucleic-acid-binding protein